jgi:hypothetical protein
MLPVLLWVRRFGQGCVRCLPHRRSLLLKLIEQTIDESNRKTENIFDNAMVVIEFSLTF